MMKKVIYVSFALILLLAGIHSTGEAAVSGNLVLVPEAKMINGNGEIAGEIRSGSGRVSGLLKLTEWLQVGGEISSDKNDEIDFAPLAKVLIINEYKYGLDLATGLRAEDLYITAGKSFANGIKGHLGLGNESMGGLFVGVSKVLSTEAIQISEEKGNRQKSAVSSIPPVKLSAEYFDQSVNLGIRANINRKLYVNLDLLDFEDFTAGVSYSF